MLPQDLLFLLMLSTAVSKNPAVVPMIRVDWAYSDPLVVSLLPNLPFLQLEMENYEVVVLLGLPLLQQLQLDLNRGV